MISLYIKRKHYIPTLPYCFSIFKIKMKIIYIFSITSHIITPKITFKKKAIKTQRKQLISHVLLSNMSFTLLLLHVNCYSWWIIEIWWGWFIEEIKKTIKCLYSIVSIIHRCRYQKIEAGQLPFPLFYFFFWWSFLVWITLIDIVYFVYMYYDFIFSFIYTSCIAIAIVIYLSDESLILIINWKRAILQRSFLFLFYALYLHKNEVLLYWIMHHYWMFLLV